MEVLQAPEGDVIAEHAATLSGRAALVLFAFAPAGLCFFAATQSAYGQTQVLPSAVGCMLAMLGVMGFVQQNRSRVVVRADGIERWGLRGKRWALRWSEMNELHYRVVTIRLGGLLGMLMPALGTRIQIALVGPDGIKRRVPSNLKAMEVLAERVTEQQTTAHFAAARARLDAGEGVQFGKSLELHGDKLTVRGLFGRSRSCALESVERFAVRAGTLRILQRGKTFAFARLPTAAIPNVFLLLRLLETMLRQSPAALRERDFAARAVVG